MDTGTTDDLEALQAAVERLHAAGGDANRLVVQANGPASMWLAVSARATRPRWTLEAAPTLDREVMRGLGWTQIAPEAAWRTLVPGRGEAAAVRVVERVGAVVAALFGPDGHAWVLRLGNAPAVKSGDLVREMREVASTRENQTQRRQQLYHALVASEFLVPLGGAGSGDPRGGTARWRQAGTLAGRPVHAVFTDWASACVWDPRGPEVVTMRGRDLFVAIASSSAASLLINPGGDVGGELYRHELETLAAGIARMAGRH